jgi:hypothetical protein
MLVGNMTPRFFQNIILFIGIMLICSVMQAQSGQYMKVRVKLEGPENVRELQQLDIGLDHFKFFDDHIIEFVIPGSGLDHLRSSGLSYVVLDSNMLATYYKNMNEHEFDPRSQVRPGTVAKQFGYGSMGGFYTLSEIEDQLDSLYQKYPTLVSEKFSIGQTFEGRDIWAIKISDFPDEDENEEAVYYDALHHAREPLSMAVVMNYAFWLLENYHLDDRVRYIVDNREIYIVPCVNPDGYEYNRELAPMGGGLWRKNRNAAQGGCTGVDLNRNYSLGFANNNSCSSGSPCSETYRGTEPFSELETKAVKRFIEDIRPTCALSIHSTAGVCLLPVDSIGEPTDFDIYSEWGTDFLSYSDYPFGTAFQMLGYSSCGTTRSYLHSQGTFCWTLEVDGSGFWPDEHEIFDLVGENIETMFYQSWIAGQYTDVQSHKIYGSALPGNDFGIQVEVKNKGFGFASSSIEVTIESLDSGVTSKKDALIGVVPARSRTFTENIVVNIDSSFRDSILDLEIIVKQDGVETNREPLRVPIGHRNVVFEDDAENGSSNWTSSSKGISWDVTSDDSYDGFMSFCDSKGTNSESPTNVFFELKDGVDISWTTRPYLEFFSKWSLNKGDLVFLLVSSEGGTGWKTLDVYEGAEPWGQNLYDLSEYKGSDVRVRFVLFTRAWNTGDGFYFDKLSITDYNKGVQVNAEDIDHVDFDLLPNPVNNYVFIQGPIDNVEQIRIINANGSLVGALSPVSNELFLGNLGKGLYIIQLIDETGRITYQERIIKVSY